MCTRPSSTSFGARLREVIWSWTKLTWSSTNSKESHLSWTMRDREPLPTLQSTSCSVSTSPSTFVVWPKWKVEYPTVSITKIYGSSQASGQVRSGSSGFTSRMFQTPSSFTSRTHTTRTSQLAKVVTARRSIQKLEKKCYAIRWFELCLLWIALASLNWIRDLWRW